MYFETVERDIEFETPSGKVWEFSASGRICNASPSVGIMDAYIDDIRLYWQSGKEFSQSSYARVKKYRCFQEQVSEDLLECV